MTRTSFSSFRTLGLAVVATVGAMALVGCKSNDAYYRPAPRYNTYGPTTTYGPSTGGTMPAPSPAPAPAPAPGGQMACGAGKCG